MNCEISGQPVRYRPPPQDDDYVTFNGNQCLVGSACWFDWLDYQHDPAADQAIIAFLIGDDYHGCVDGNSGFFGRAFSCITLVLDVIPGGGDISEGSKGVKGGGKVFRWMIHHGDDAAKMKRLEETSDAAWDIANHASDERLVELGFSSVDDAAVYVDDVMHSGPGRIAGDHKYWLDEANQIVVLRGPNPAVPGTIYRPDNWGLVKEALEKRTTGE